MGDLDNGLTGDKAFNQLVETRRALQDADHAVCAAGCSLGFGHLYQFDVARRGSQRREPRITRNGEDAEKSDRLRWTGLRLHTIDYRLFTRQTLAPKN
jgi:hypothetical protein